MGIFANKKVTIFNYHLDNSTENEKWIPHLLDGVNIVKKKGANISTTGLIDADGATLFVDKSKLGNYISPVEWSCLSYSEKENHITFTPQKDFFVEGDLTNVTVLNDGFLEWMRNKYTDLYVVTNVDKYEDVMPHFEIGGK